MMIASCLYACLLMTIFKRLSRDITHSMLVKSQASLFQENLHPKQPLSQPIYILNNQMNNSQNLLRLLSSSNSNNQSQNQNNLNLLKIFLTFLDLVVLNQHLSSQCNHNNQWCNSQVWWEVQWCNNQEWWELQCNSPEWWVVKCNKSHLSSHLNDQLQKKMTL